MMSVGLLLLVLVMVVVWVQATDNPDIYLDVVSIILRKVSLNLTYVIHLIGIFALCHLFASSRESCSSIIEATVVTRITINS